MLRRQAAFIGLAVLVGCGRSGESSGVRAIPQYGTPGNMANVAVAIVSPQSGLVVQNPVRIELVLGGFELGVPTAGAEDRGIMLAEGGQHLHVVIDDEAYIAVFDAATPLVLPELAPGPHAVRVFPALQWHEAVKSPGAFEAVQFHVGQPGGDFPITPGAPLLTYSRPVGTYRGADADSVLLDFHLRNARLGAGGYKVTLSVDGARVDDLTEWVPYYLVGLTPGEHTIALQLKDAGGKIVRGAYNTTQRTITIE